MSRPDARSRKDDLWDSFRAIRSSLLDVANDKQAGKRIMVFQYPTLARLAGREEDWQTGGSIRDWMYSGRRDLIAQLCLFFKADDRNHAGLMFTCDPLTGTNWEETRISERSMSDGLKLAEIARLAEGFRPAHRSYFRAIGKHAKRIHSEASKLAEVGATNNPLKLLKPGDDDE